MNPSAQSPWRLEFTRKAAITRELELRLRDEKILKDKREKEKGRNDLADEHADMLAMVEIVLATDQQIAAFSAKLDTYDAATVEALMANEAALQVVRDRIQQMLLEAHTLPDGRRVFKTRDGTQIFDEFGQEIKADELSPDEISNDKTRWEDWLDTKQQELDLIEERRELLEYQEKLDHARERLDDPALTQEDLDALDAELADAMPERVQAIVAPENRAQQAAPDYLAEQRRFQTTAKLDIAAP